MDAHGLMGTTLDGKYRIEARVGGGGYGDVYRAVHTVWDEPVALKFFTALSNAPAHLRDELLEQFVQEGKLLSRLSSETAGIVQARDVGTVTTPKSVWMPYMVLEWLDGVPLDAVLASRRAQGGQGLSAGEGFDTLDGVARAVALAHAHGVAHRDIKPGNFFVLGGNLQPGATIKLLDFGIAKVMQDVAQPLYSTAAGVTSFTPAYGAPEQFDRTHGATGPWTDVFAMALVLAELMQGGRPALDGDSFVQYAFASQNPEKRPTPRTLGIEVSDEVEAVFARALSVPVAERYPSMAEFWNALAGALGRTTQIDVSSVRRGGAGASSVVARPDLDAGPRTPAGTEIRGPISPLQPIGSITPSRVDREASAGTSHPDTPTPDVAAMSQAHRAASQSGMSADPTEVTPGAGARRGRIIGAVGAAIGLAGLAALVLPELGGEAAPSTEVRTAAAAPPAAPEVPAEPPAPPCPDGMVLIEGSHFFMGTDSEAPVLKGATPAHKVEVESYCIDVHEVTAGEFRECSDAGECKRAYDDSEWPQGSMDEDAWEGSKQAFSELCTGRDAALSDHPINCVTWGQARDYCDHRGGRLPTEPEWELAARGTDGRVFPWGDDAPTAEHLNGGGPEYAKWRAEHDQSEEPTMYDVDDGYPGTAPVGSFPKGKTQAGLFDMTGNVFEWTADEFHPYLDSGKGPEGTRVIRGGAFNSFMAEFTDPALRFPLSASAHSHGVGFRCAADPVEVAPAGTSASGSSPAGGE